MLEKKTPAHLTISLRHRQVPFICFWCRLRDERRTRCTHSCSRAQSPCARSTLCKLTTSQCARVELCGSVTASALIRVVGPRAVAGMVFSTALQSTWRISARPRTPLGLPFRTPEPLGLSRLPHPGPARSRPGQCHHNRLQTAGARFQGQAEDDCHFSGLNLNALHNSADDFALGRPIWIVQLRLDVI